MSPLDPQLFSPHRRLRRRPARRASAAASTRPIEVAQWIEDYAAAAAEAPWRARSGRPPERDRPEYRRLAIDIAVAADLGRFFGAKFRAGVLYRIFDRTGDRAALEEALQAYRAARAAWAAIVDRTKGVYAPDITVGELPPVAWSLVGTAGGHRRRHRGGRRDGSAPPSQHGPTMRSRVPSRRPSAGPYGQTWPGRHTPPARFQPGAPLAVEFAAARAHASVRLHYRHVNQGERWHATSMTPNGLAWSAAIPGDYTRSVFPLQDYFEVTDAPSRLRSVPGLGEHLTRQPYFVVRRHRSRTQRSRHRARAGFTGFHPSGANQSRVLTPSGLVENQDTKGLIPSLFRSPRCWCAARASPNRRGSRPARFHRQTRRQRRPTCSAPSTLACTPICVPPSG